MEITLGEIRIAEPALKQFNQKELPIKLSYRLAKIYRAVIEECQEIENERVKLIQANSNGTPDVNGNYIVLPENMEAVRTKLEELFTTVTNIDFEPVSLKELGDMKIKPDDLVVLDKFIVDE